MNKNKIYILILIVLFLNYSLLASFSYAQFSVPVYDSLSGSYLGKLTEILGTMNKFLTENIQKLNENIQLIINGQIENKIDQIISNSLEEQTYLEASIELEKLIEKNTIKSEKDIEKDLEEAKLAGIILALREFPSLGCVPSTETENVYNYTIGIIASITDVDFSEMVREAIGNMPICEPSLNYTNLFVRKQKEANKSFLAKLLTPFSIISKPFNISLLAQISQPSNTNNNQAPSFEITPAFQEIENSNILFNLEVKILDLINQRVSEMVNKRKTQLGDVRPIEECTAYAVIKGGKDDGRLVCLNYKTIVDLKSIRDRLKENTPLVANNSDPNIYSKILGTNLLAKLGLTTSSLASTTYLTGFLPLDNEDELTKLIDKICSNYSLAQELKTEEGGENKEGTRSVSYIKCLQMLLEKINLLLEIEEKKVNDLNNLASTTAQLASITATEIQNLQNKINNNDSRKCQGINKDLEELNLIVSGIYTFFKGPVAYHLADLANTIYTIKASTSESVVATRDLLKQTFTLPYKILKKIDNILNSFQTFSNFLSLFKPPSDLLNLVQDITKFLTDIKQGYEDVEKSSLTKAVAISIKVFKTTEKISKDIQKTNEAKNKIFKLKFSKATIQDDLNTLNELHKKLKIYQELVEECNQQNQQNQGRNNQGKREDNRNQARNNKSQLIIVRQKEEKRGWNWLNIFKWKSFEITFQK